MPTERCVLPTPTEPTNSRPVLSVGYSSTNRPARKRASRMLLYRLVVRIALEVGEFAVLVTRRNVRRRQQALAAVLHTALAAHHFALLAALDGLPSCAAADGARLSRCGHDSESTARRNAAQPDQPRFCTDCRDIPEESVGICGNPGFTSGLQHVLCIRARLQTCSARKLSALRQPPVLSPSENCHAHSHARPTCWA